MPSENGQVQPVGCGEFGSPDSRGRGSPAPAPGAVPAGSPPENGVGGSRSVASLTAAQADPVVQHFDSFAERYDRERFETSYGRYVHAQERRLLRRWLAPYRRGKILDLPCGTGRFLEFATHGLDASPAMLEVARRKYPDRVLRLGRAEDLSRLGETFDAVFCLHLFMHLSAPAMTDIIEACRQTLRMGGLFIFDFPCARRRRLTGFRAAGWHGGNAPSRREVAAMLGERWVLRRVRSTLFFPIHQIPHGLRPWLRPLDDLIGLTPLRSWASYLVYGVERRL